ncbi:MAG: nucleoside triphosphate pyrophosphohydrolase [Proteobacteria bacterium]|nr:nucleoside triphosphate pyrophosphohydrolase [Pseudomonadota bacterium]
MDVDRIIQLIQTLRGEGGCPWDKKQTPQSLSTYLIEEAYELVEAIEKDNGDEIRNELGDVLFQILFIAELYREKGAFDLAQIIEENIRKMEGRHPHVFGDVKVTSVQDVKKNWDKIKAKEKKDTDGTSALESVPASLPALMRAYRISSRAAGEGFDWDDIEGVMEKVEEEWFELKDALKEKSIKDVALEFGDILFTLVNVARFAGIHPETALKDSTGKFEKRYLHMKKALAGKGLLLPELSQEEKDIFWERAKAET